MSQETLNPEPGSTTSNFDESDLELYTINEKVAQKYHENLVELLKDEHHPITKYLADRKVSVDEITKWKLGYAPDQWKFLTTPLLKQNAFKRAIDAGICIDKEGKQYDFFRNRLMIPLLDEQRRIVGFTGRAVGDQQPKYLNTPATPIFRKSELLFGADQAIRPIIRSKIAVLTEGNFDVISLHQFGVINAVGKGGTALTREQIETLKRICEVVILIYDVDPNGVGQAALAKDCEQLLDAGFRVQIFHLQPASSSEKIDADSWLRQFMNDERPAKFDLYNFIQKGTEEGILWLASLWNQNSTLAEQVEHEKRLIELLSKVQDEDWLKKYARKLAVEGDMKSWIQRATKLRKLSIQKADEIDQDDEVESTKGLKSVWYKRDGSIWIYGAKNWVCVAEDFQIFVKYFTENEYEEKGWILEIKRKADPEPLYLEISHEEFCSATKLKNKLTGNWLALKITDTYLSELQQHLFRMKKTIATKVTRLGYHEDSRVYFFANKAVNGQLLNPDEFNIVNTELAGKTIHLAMPIPIKKKLKPFFMYTEGAMRFNDWFDYMVRIHKYDNAIIPACFYLMALFRDVVVKNTNTSPMLYLKGGASSGKSSIVRSMCSLFGFKEPAANLKSRVLEAALIKKMSQLSNSLVWLDEMNNEFEHKGVLQASYDNTGYSRSNDNTSIETNSVDIYSAVAITSNYLLDDEILFTRCVFIPISEQQKTEQQSIDYKTLDDLQSPGLACVTVELLKHRELIEQHFSSAFKTLYTKLHQEVKQEGVVIRLVSNMAQVLTVAYILQLHGKVVVMEHGDPEGILEEFVSIGSRVILRQHQIAAEKSNLSDFFEIIQSQYDSGFLYEGVHFSFHGHEVWLRFSSLYRMYSQRYRQAFYKAPADRDTIRNEMLSFEGLPEEDKSRFYKSIRFAPEPHENCDKPTRSVSDSCAMNYAKLQDTYGLDLEYKRDTGKLR